MPCSHNYPHQFIKSSSSPSSHISYPNFNYVAWEIKVEALGYTHTALPPPTVQYTITISCTIYACTKSDIKTLQISWMPAKRTGSPHLPPSEGITLPLPNIEHHSSIKKRKNGALPLLSMLIVDHLSSLVLETVCTRSIRKLGTRLRWPHWWNDVVAYAH